MMKMEEGRLSQIGVRYITYRTSCRLYTDLFFSMYAWKQAEGENYKVTPDDYIEEKITVVCFLKTNPREYYLGEEPKWMTSYVR
jgi:hypothetical protein